jgi:hypothetical protein
MNLVAGLSQKVSWLAKEIFLPFFYSGTAAVD